MLSNIIVTVALTLALLPYHTAAQEPNCVRNYTVNLFDTCDGISAAHNVSTFQLAHVNADKINVGCTNLAEGEPLCLGVSGQDCNIIHVVASGDGCDTISSGAGIPFSTLLSNNPNIASDCTNIYPGEVLCTATQIFNYTTA